MRLSRISLATVLWRSSFDFDSCLGSRMTPPSLPDVIFVNGDIYTQAKPPRAQAMAVRDGRIVAVGSNDEIRKLKGS